MMTRFLAMAFFLIFPLTSQANLEQAMLSDSYSEVLNQITKNLQERPNDASSLFLWAMYTAAIHHPDNIKAFTKLKRTNKHYAKCLEQIISSTYKIRTSNHLKQNQNTVIVALGSPTDEEGKPQMRLQNTLEKTLDVAKAYPSAPIIVTGGAIKNGFTEAFAMKNWLIKQGIDKNRIITESKAYDTLSNAKNSKLRTYALTKSC